MKKYEYRFSIVSAVYNSGKYIPEMIKSLLNQTMSFKKYVQLILVNDGSTDNSAEICKKYQKRYPDNIIYLEKDNEGPSAARNMGVSYAKGQYINFLDSDDTLSKNTFKSVWSFFEKNNTKVNIVTIPVQYFEKRSGLHNRYEKFNNETYIVDLEENPKSYILSCAASFYKSTVIKKLKFNTNLKVGEDLYLNSKLFIDKPRFGIISADDATYNYRIRYANDSITNANQYEESWLIYVLGYIHKGFTRYYNRKENRGKYPPDFIKYILISEIIRRIKTPNFITRNTLKEFYKISKEILSNIDDEIIMNCDYDNDYYILAMLFMLKTGEFNIKNIILLDDKNNIKINNEIIENIENYSIKISTVKIVDGELYIQGYFNDILPGDFKIYYKNGNIPYETTVTETDNIFLQKRFFDIIVAHTYLVQVKIPLESGTYCFILKVQEKEINLELKNIYGDDGILVNQTHATNNMIYDLKINNKKVLLNNRSENLFNEANSDDVDGYSNIPENI